jgi:hypothetical protein
MTKHGDDNRHNIHQRVRFPDKVFAQVKDSETGEHYRAVLRRIGYRVTLE